MSSLHAQPAQQPVIVDDLSVSFGGRHVLDGLNLTAQPGRRIGLIGENGTGKSTLLRAVAGCLPRRSESSGSIMAPEDLLFLRQETPYQDFDSIADVLAATLAPLRAAVAELEQLAGRLGEADESTDSVAQRYSSVLEWSLAHDAWDADRRAQEAAERLGLGELAQDRLIGTLSGGQRTRLALAAAMTRRPDAILLDEPTNHLDDEAIAVLVEFLLGLPGVVLLASHDRVLLDEVCTDLFDLDPIQTLLHTPTSGHGSQEASGRRFGGGWSDYVAHQEAARTRWEQTYAEQQDELKQLRGATAIGTGAIAHNRGPTDNDKFIHGFKGSRVQQTLARRKKDAARRLSEAEATQVRKPPRPFRLRADLTGGATASGRIIQVRDLEVTGRCRVPRLDVETGEHLLITGANGSGKSTLLGVLAGRVQPDRGVVDVATSRVAELTQDPVFSNPQRTARGAYLDAVGAELAELVPLGELGLVPPVQHRVPVGLLSVGQRRRLSLAIAIATGPELLLLDEPTNHISLALAGEIEEALGSAAGTVVVASHDRWLRRRWQGPSWELPTQPR